MVNIPATLIPSNDGQQTLIYTDAQTGTLRKRTDSNLADLEK